MPQVEEVIARMTGDVELEGEITPSFKFPVFWFP
jgi:hypothetical protein